MENVQRNIIDRGGNFDDSDVLYPCSAVEEKYAVQCYPFHSFYILKDARYSAEKTFEVCDTIESEKIRASCYYGVGMNIGLPSSSYLDHLIDRCQSGDPAYHADCISGAVYIMADQDTIPKAMEICKHSPDNLKENCYEQIGGWIKKSYTLPDKQEDLCSLVEEKYVSVCNGANPLEL